MDQRITIFLFALVLAGIAGAGCTSSPGEPHNQSGNLMIPATPQGTARTPPDTVSGVPCGTNSCLATEQCCNGFCLDPAVYTCCRGKPCQGSCCTVSGTERCYDPGKQECCENTLCDVGGCCAGSCTPPGQYFCVYVNGTGCYGLPDYLRCVWKDGGYALVRTNVPFGEIEPSYEDIVIVPAARIRDRISEYWIIPAYGGGGRAPAQRVREG